jgi:hypothetical protein
MVNRVAERLVHMPFHLRVKADHLADGHPFLLVIANEAKQSSLRSAVVDCRVTALLAMTNVS